jgi:hypothetical protein
MSEKYDLEELAPWLAIVITLIGGGLRILLLDHKGMWLDETFSVWLANHSVVELLQWTAKIDQHPPLYYLLLHYWVALNGDTPHSVRLLSALFGAGTIPIVYLIGKRMSGAIMGLAAAVLLALSPFNIRFAQEARMYTCLTFNAAVAIYALSDCLQIHAPSGPSAANFGNTCMPGAQPGRSNQTPRDIPAIGLIAAVKPGGEPGYPAIVGYPSKPLRPIWPGLPSSCSLPRPCSPTMRRSFSP